MTACDSMFYRLIKGRDGAAEGDLDKLVAVNFDIEWTAITRHFDFDVDLHPQVLGDAIAREPWTREFFSSLRAYVFCQHAFTAHWPFGDRRFATAGPKLWNSCPVQMRQADISGCLSIFCSVMRLLRILTSVKLHIRNVFTYLLTYF